MANPYSVGLGPNGLNGINAGNGSYGMTGWQQPNQYMGVMPVQNYNGLPAYYSSGPTQMPNPGYMAPQNVEMTPGAAARANFINGLPGPGAMGGAVASPNYQGGFVPGMGLPGQQVGMMQMGQGMQAGFAPPAGNTGGMNPGGFNGVLYGGGPGIGPNPANDFRGMGQDGHGWKYAGRADTIDDMNGKDRAMYDQDIQLVGADKKQSRGKKSPAQPDNCGSCICCNNGHGNPGQFDYGLLECCTEPCMCCKFYFCGHCIIAKSFSNLRGMACPIACICMCPCCIPCRFRTAVREKYAIHGTKCKDWCLICSPCAFCGLLQAERHHREYAPEDQIMCK